MRAPDVNGDGELCGKIGRLNHGHEVSRFAIDDKAGRAAGGTDSASAWLRPNGHGAGCDGVRTALLDGSGGWT